MKAIQTSRLPLRDWTENDVQDFFEYARNPDVGPNARWKPHESVEESRCILTGFIEKQEVWAMFRDEYLAIKEKVC